MFRKRSALPVVKLTPGCFNWAQEKQCISAKCSQVVIQNLPYDCLDRSWLNERSLSKYLQSIMFWCHDKGVSNLQEILPHLDELSDAPCLTAWF